MKSIRDGFVVLFAIGVIASVYFVSITPILKQEQAQRDMVVAETMADIIRARQTYESYQSQRRCVDVPEWQSNPKSNSIRISFYQEYFGERNRVTYRNIGDNFISALDVTELRNEPWRVCWWDLEYPEWPDDVIFDLVNDKD